jgi:hypothetical protein
VVVEVEGLSKAQELTRKEGNITIDIKPLKSGIAWLPAFPSGTYRVLDGIGMYEVTFPFFTRCVKNYSP